MQRIFRHFSCVAAAVMLSMAMWSESAVAQLTLEVVPPNPRYLEPVIVRMKPQGIVGGIFIHYARASMSGNTITINIRSVIDLGIKNYELEIGRFPEGTYALKVVGQLAGDPVATAQFTVSGPEDPDARPRNLPVINYSDLWWNPAESGWGLSVIQGPQGVLVAVWFTFDPDGKPVWYSLQPGQWSGDSRYSGPIYKANGPYFGMAFDPSAVGVTQVGTGNLFFRDHASGEFTYTVEGVSGKKSIVRSGID